MEMSIFDPLRPMLFLVLFLALVGAAIGSFLALVADRLPRGEGVVAAGSACRACGSALGWAEKLPVISYLVLRGRCGQCGAVIPMWFWSAEVLGLMIPFLAMAVAETPAQLVLGCGFLWCLLGLGLCDLAAFRLPDALTGTLGALGLGLAVEDPARGVGDGVLAAAVAAGLFWALRLIHARLRRREGLGLGDVKLIGGIAAGLGLGALPVVTLIAGCAAIAGAGLRLHDDGASAGAGATARARADLPIPFGAYLAAAAAVVWLAMA